MSQTSGNNLWVILETLVRRRGMIVGIVAVVTIAAIIVSLILPKWYQAQVLLLPPKEMSNSLDQSSKLSEIVSVTGGLNLPVMVTPSDVYARILRSQRVSDQIISKFDLANRYRTVSRTDTYAALMEHARFAVTQEGLLTISVEDRDPKISADMANAFADELNKLNQEIVSDRARRYREFVQARVAEAKVSLDSARAELESFQKANRAVDFDAQTKMAIDQAAELKVSLARIDLDIKMKEQTLGKDHPDLVTLRQRREVVTQQLRRLESGGQDSSYFSLPVASIPTLKGKYELLYGRVKVSESLYNMLLEQLERAKLQEQDQTPSISILDRAREPEIRSRPRRTLIVGIAFILSFIAALMLAAVLDYLDRLRERDPEDYRRAAYVLDSLFGWLPGVRRRSSGA